jgi:glycosyltransferase involved in cell wall biosynthesis
MISVVIPCFNEAECLPETLPVIVKELREISPDWEIVLVDDGSQDQTYTLMKNAVTTSNLTSREDIRLVKLRRNYGHMRALRAGIEVAKFDWVVTMDLDLQDPPRVIREMLFEAEASNSCLVVARRKTRDYDGKFKRFSAFWYYKTVKFLAGQEIQENVADFRLMHKCVVNWIKSSQESQFVFRLLLPKQGFKSSTVDFARPPRVYGTTKYSLHKMLKLALDSSLTFGVKPLRICGFAGIVLGVFTFLLGVFQIGVYLTDNSIPGVPSILLPMLFLNAFILVAIGIMGEYLGVLLSEIRNREIDVIEKCNRQIST